MILVLIVGLIILQVGIWKWCGRTVMNDLRAQKFASAALRETGVAFVLGAINIIIFVLAYYFFEGYR